MKFSIKDLVTFTEDILNGNLHFFCSDCRLLIFPITKIATGKCFGFLVEIFRIGKES